MVVEILVLMPVVQVVVQVVVHDDVQLVVVLIEVLTLVAKDKVVLLLVDTLVL